MKHITLLLFVAVLVTSCTTQNKTPRQTPLEKEMNQYLYMSKQNIMLRYGYNPVKDGVVEGLGKVLVYTELKTSGLGLYARQYYKHTMFVLDSTNYCIGWSVRNEQIPFDRLDVRVFRN